jgi:hypothetical protein
VEGVKEAVTQLSREEQAAEAHELQRLVKESLVAIRREWVVLGERLYAFRQARGWEALGLPSFEEWLASPEIELGRRTVFQLIEAYRELVVERSVPLEELETTEITKVAEVLPAIRRKQVDPRDALADTRVLSRRDLHEKYDAIRPESTRDEAERGRPLDAEEEPPLEQCPACGTWVRRKRTS